MNWRKPDGWTALSVLVQVIGVALCAFVYFVLIGEIPFLKSLSGFWTSLVIIDLSIVTWAYIMWYTPWYSWWFVENKPGRASVGRSKRADGKTIGADGSPKGLYAFRAAWQGKLPWVQPFIGFNTTAVIIIDKLKSNSPLKIICQNSAGNNQQTGCKLHYKFNLSPMLDRLCHLALMDEERIIEDFDSNTAQETIHWCRDKSEDVLFAGIGKDGALQKFIANMYGGDGVASDFEKDRATEIKCLMFTEIDQDDTTKKVRRAGTTFGAVADGIKTLTGAFPATVLEKLDPNMILYMSGQTVSEVGGEPIFIFGGGDTTTALLEAATKRKGKGGKK